MKAEDFITTIQKRADKNGLKCTNGEPVQEDTIAEFEKLLGKSIPNQVKLFYKTCNGLVVEEPALEIKGLEELFIDEY